MAKSKLTMAGLSKRLDQHDLTLKKILDILNSRGDKKSEEPTLEVKYPVLSTITEIGAIVEIGELGSIRLCDLDYNGTGKKLWQFVNVIKPNEVNLGLPETTIKAAILLRRMLKKS